MHSYASNLMKFFSEKHFVNSIGVSPNTISSYKRKDLQFYRTSLINDNEFLAILLLTQSNDYII